MMEIPIKPSMGVHLPVLLMPGTNALKDMTVSSNVETDLLLLLKNAMMET